MKIVPLTKGKEALVDDCDYEYLMQWKWQLHRRRSAGYAKHIRYMEHGRKSIYMHRVVAERCGLNVEAGDVDHIDGNDLNNQRGNLRIAT